MIPGQRELIARAPGDSPGWKIGFNIPAAQEHFGLDGPVVGYLAPPGPVEAAIWEYEIAAWIGTDGGIAALGPAIELVTIDPSKERLEEIMAGNIHHRGVILGDPVVGAQHETATEMVERARLVLADHGGELRPGAVVITGALEVGEIVPGEPLTNDLSELHLGSVSHRP
ncbi:MAG: hypothetical protein H0V29_08100 [Thermoleophilaceae bacterium]|nr:hypothetical protein [Thermoleophilaceae bacterium]